MRLLSVESICKEALLGGIVSPEWEICVRIWEVPQLWVGWWGSVLKNAPHIALLPCNPDYLREHLRTVGGRLGLIMLIFYFKISQSSANKWVQKILLKAQRISVLSS